MKQGAAFSRREVLRLGALTLGVHALSAARGAVPKDSFEFIVVNDTHYLNKECGTWITGVVAAMRESAPEAAFCLHAGDLTDLGTRVASAAVAELFAHLGCPLHPVPGNHDFIRNDDRSGYDAAFPRKLNYRFDHGVWQFLALDTTQGMDFQDTEISAVTLGWLDAEIPKLDAARPVFAFTHFPLGTGVAFRPRNADALLARLAKTSLRWVHSGHWHGESVKSHGPATITTSRCCARLRDNRDGSPLKGWHVYRASADGVLARRFVSAPPVQ